MWGVKLHTANADWIDGAGTDNNMKMKFKIMEEYDGPNGEKELKEAFSCTTEWLNNEGMWRGDSNQYMARQLGKYQCSLTIENFHQFQEFWPLFGVQLFVRLSLLT